MRDNRFIHGDRNTTYFHIVAKIRASKNSISFFQDGDRVLIDLSDIEVHVVNYFKSIWDIVGASIKPGPDGFGGTSIKPIGT